MLHDLRKKVAKIRGSCHLLFSRTFTRRYGLEKISYFSNRIN
jgi:hypothetical protein